MSVPSSFHSPSAKPVPAAAVSVFDEVFDVVVLGAGYVGLGAVEALRRRGLRVLVIEPSGQLLWESTRALETCLAAGPEQVAWTDWLDALRRRQGADARRLDPAFAEIRVQRDWADDDGVRLLYYAMPLGLTVRGDRVVALTLATKSGHRTVRAHHWIDASENGLLATLLRPEARALRRRPLARRHRLVLQAPRWDADLVAALSDFDPAADSRLEPSLRSTERRLAWLARSEDWHTEMIARLGRLRELAPIPSPLVVSQFSAEPLPSYPSNNYGPRADGPETPANLLVVSPAFGGGALDSLGARFSWGHAHAQKLVPEKPGAGPADDAPPFIRIDSVREISCEVLVAGAGTAGALAAISAARAGARTCAADFALFPGGVGTGGGITGYFHGLEGGLQAETDALTHQLDGLLEGRELARRRWHHEGKKLALLAMFGAEGVAFHGGSLLCEVEKDDHGRVRGVLVATPEGPLRFRAASFVDCTGDGDLCAFAGASYAFGRDGDGRTLAYSQSAFVLKAEAGGLVVTSCNFDSGWTDPIDVEDLTRARIEGVLQHERALWEERTFPLGIAPLPGIRQSRQIDTDRALDFSDLVDHTRFADRIGEASSIADTHSVDFEFEDDEALFFFWVCRLFRHALRAQLPYRMLLPRGLENVWIACRAAGVSVTAAYAVRMQRDMQRLGEVAGRAAALAARAGLSSRQVPVASLVAPETPAPARADERAPGELAALLDDLAAGRPGLHLWRLYRHPRLPREALSSMLRERAVPAAATFHAAAVLAMRGDPAGEPRLLEAISKREDGPPPSPENSGAHGQEIDAPFWLIAVALLRRCGTRSCAPVLGQLADAPDGILNVRTAVGLSLERLASRGVLTPDEAADLAERLIRHPLPDPVLAPSRSIWRTLRNDAQIVLRNDTGAPTRQDHAWQLHLVVARVRANAGRPLHPAAADALRDPRAHVARAFARLAPRTRSDARRLVA